MKRKFTVVIEKKQGEYEARCRGSRHESAVAQLFSLGHSTMDVSSSIVVGSAVIVQMSQPPNKSPEPSAAGFYTVLQKKVGRCKLC